jgi:hypothetical protein
MVVAQPVLASAPGVGKFAFPASWGNGVPLGTVVTCLPGERRDAQAAAPSGLLRTAPLLISLSHTHDISDVTGYRHEQGTTDLVEAHRRGVIRR